MSQGFATNNRRMWLIAAGVLTCFAVVGFRLVSLHVLQRDDLLRFVEKARYKIEVEKARRGDILDAKGNTLATSRSFIVFGADPELLREKDIPRWAGLARLLGQPASEFEQKLRTAMQSASVSLNDPGTPRLRYLKIADEVDESVYKEILAYMQKERVVGFYGNRGYKRVYPGGRLAAHLLGYVNREFTPVTGTERSFDLYLRGHDGWIESEKDGARRELARFRRREVAPQDGDSVTLTIDSVVQTILERELDTIAEKFQPAFATIIASDPRTGEILGLANYPAYDPNNYGRAEIAAQRNRAITDIVEPGSTFKIVASSAALNEGLVTPSTMFDCGATSVFYKGRDRKMPKDDHPFTFLSVADIVSHSSNRGAAQLAMLLGEERFYKYAKAFGFGESTYFQLGGEVRGILDDPKHWDGLTITRMPMGHSVAATPLQIHMAMSAIASGGTLLRPQIVREIRAADGSLVRTFGTETRRQVLQPSSAALAARLLERVASPDGTAPEVAIKGYEIAGKTGTTQKLVDGRYVNNRHVASFVGFFPASRPEVVLSVIVDDAKVAGTAYGRTVAAPSFRRVAEQLIQYLDIKPVHAPTLLLATRGGAQ